MPAGGCEEAEGEAGPKVEGLGSPKGEVEVGLDSFREIAGGARCEDPSMEVGPVLVPRCLGAWEPLRFGALVP